VDCSGGVRGGSLLFKGGGGVVTRGERLPSFTPLSSGGRGLCPMKEFTGMYWCNEGGGTISGYMEDRKEGEHRQVSLCFFKGQKKESPPGRNGAEQKT